MIHLLYMGVLYPNIERYKRVLVTEKGLAFTEGLNNVENTLLVNLIEHPFVKEILSKVKEEEQEEVKKAIIYQTFNLICQRFTGKSLVDGVLIPIENDVLNLDGALKTLTLAGDKKDETDK